jgi:hypothetical protein
MGTSAISLSNRLSWRLQHGGYVNGGGPGQCFSSLAHLEAPANWVRLLYFNDQPTPLTVDGAALAPTSAVGDGVSPSNADGQRDDSLWRQVTFNGGGADVEPLAQYGGGAVSLSIPAHHGPPGRPIIMFSDWIPLTPVPNSQFGSMLLIRSYSAGVVRYSGALGVPHSSLGRIHAGFWSGGNGTVAPWRFDPRPFNGLFASFGLQYVTASTGATVVGIGDSIMQCMSSTGQLSSFGARACTQVSTARRPVSYFNEGYIGRRSDDYCSNGVWDIQTLRPQVALIQTWSQNDPNTQDGADLGFARAMAVTDVAMRHQCLPVLVTAAPVFSARPDLERFRQNNVERVRTAAQHGFPMLDLDALWGTGAVPNAYRPEYDSGDATHQNDAACAVAADALAGVLKEALGR